MQGCHRYVRAAHTGRLSLCLYHFIFIIGLQLDPVIQEFLDIKGEAFIEIRRVFIVRMLRQVIFVRKQQPQPSEG